MADSTPSTAKPSPIVGAASQGKPGATSAGPSAPKGPTSGGPAPAASKPAGEGFSASKAKLPPKAPDADTTNLTESFQTTRQQLESVMGQQNQNLMELKVSALQAMEEALSRLETEGKRCRALLDRNEVLARDAERLITQGNTLEEQQDELEAKVEKAAERNQALADRANELREERTRLLAERDELEAAVQKETDDLSTARADVQRLEQRKEKLEGENAELERIRNRLEENIARLERLRDEFMTAVKRLKNTKDGLVGVAMDAATGGDSGEPS